MVIVNHQQLSFDIYSELEPFLDRFPQYVIKEDKLQSCSPFRSERHPSFAVNLENGTWIDSGAVGDFRKGNFITLLSFLREEQYEDTSDYLINMYSPLKADTDDLHLDLAFLTEKNNSDDLKVFSKEELKAFAYRSRYLASRGISEEVQRLFRVGYDPEHKAVAMSWCDVYGNVVNIKFRSITDKRFWYAGGQRIKGHLYGNHVYSACGIPILAITESEIDCMRLWTLGIPAVALGTAHVSSEQGRLLLNSGAEEVVIATDNDTAGKECGKQIEAMLVGQARLTYFNFCRDSAKDISDLTDKEIINGYSERKALKIIQNS
ncbi:toprim domain-containing protein [Enterococcus sp.]|uniref:toprim domain-containing protein n=1 Tax=Enterococcus sp. TaxID=35783 RepID=UPI002FCCB0AC